MDGLFEYVQNYVAIEIKNKVNTDTLTFTNMSDQSEQSERQDTFGVPLSFYPPQ